MYQKNCLIEVSQQCKRLKAVELWKKLEIGKFCLYFQNILKMQDIHVYDRKISCNLLHTSVATATISELYL